MTSRQVFPDLVAEGDALSAAQWNDLAARTQPTGQQGFDRRPETGVARELVIVSEQDDTVTCRDPAGTATLAVAKPPYLRGATATRPGNGGATQEIWPAYNVDDVLYAIIASTSITGVIYQDLNVDARQWAEPPPGGFTP